MSSWGSPYVVKETDYFVEQVRLLTGQIEVWDEIKETIDLDLARNPKAAGQKIPETQLYAITTLTDPSLTVYYTFDDDNEIVTLVEAHLF